MIKNFIIIVIFALISGCSTDENCEERSFFDDCQLEEPLTGKLNVTVTINGNNPQVTIKIYKGSDYLKGELVAYNVVSKNETSFNLPFGEYSGTAVYMIGMKADSDSILAVDGDDISRELVEYCDSDCWEITEGNLDLTM